MTVEELGQKLLEVLMPEDTQYVKAAFQRYLNDEISLGKCAEIINMEKSDLRKFLSQNGFPIIRYSVAEAQAEAGFLLNDSWKHPNA